MLNPHDMRVGVWLYMAGLDPAEITPHGLALVDLALTGAYEDGATITKTKLKNVRAAVAARTGEAKTTAILPTWVSGDGTTAAPYRVTFPPWAIELPPDPDPPVIIVVVYETYTKAVLYEMAKARGLAVVTRMTKAEIVAALVAYDQGG